jgi:glycylpeptide N-tetradecanoyltransferase
MFRFAYPMPFLRWALTPPHYKPGWHAGVRMLRPSSGKLELVACITGVPATLEAYGRQRLVCEINFLCVDKRLRSKRLAPTLIKEVTRRVNCDGVWQAVYTAGVVLPKPVTSARYWHRSIDPKKLVEVQFTRLPAKETMARFQQRYKLPANVKSGGLRPMAAADAPSAALALNAYLARFALRPVLTEAEAAHWLLPRAGVVDCAVLTKRLPRREARAGARAAVARMCAARADWVARFPGEGAWGSGGGGGGAGSGAGALQAPEAWEELVARVAGEGGEEDEVEVVTDLVSFYHLPSTVIGNAKHSHLYAAYLYYYVSDAIPLKQLLEDTLVLAAEARIDVLNCLDLAENKPLLEALKFGPGDGHLQYYLFNWCVARFFFMPTFSRPPGSSFFFQCPPLTLRLPPPSPCPLARIVGFLQGVPAVRAQPGWPRAALGSAGPQVRVFQRQSPVAQESADSSSSVSSWSTKKPGKAPDYI